MGLEVTAAAADESLLIKLKSPNPEKPYRHKRTLRISGDVVSQSKVASLTINGKPFESLTGAPKESFNQRVPIEGEQKTTITIAAKDDQGHETTQAFDVDIRPVEINTNASKMPVAVLAFAGPDIDPAVSERLRLGAEGQLFESERFNIVDRTRLQDVLTEQQLAAVLADPSQAIQLGKIVNAHVFLVADLFERDETGIEIRARAISAETSTILETLDAFVKDKSDSAQVEAGCRKLAAQMLEAFPRVSGQLLAVKAKEDGDQLLVDWTEEDGVREGMYLLVVVEDEPFIDEDTGEALGPADIITIGRARIESFLGETGCKAKAIKGDDAEGVELVKGMAAITM